MILFIVWGFREHLGLILASAQRPHLALLSILCGVRDLSGIGCMQVKHLTIIGPTYLNFRAWNQPHSTKACLSESGRNGLFPRGVPCMSPAPSSCLFLFIMLLCPMASAPPSTYVAVLVRVFILDSKSSSMCELRPSNPPSFIFWDWSRSLLMSSSSQFALLPQFLITHCHV